MKAEARSLSFLAQESAVKIPFFQRPYVWTRDNWDELLTDLLATDKSHFLGSLILKQLNVKSGENKQVLVIDGQQRLTTLSVLLRALFDSFDEALQNMCKQDGKFDGCLYYKKDMFGEELLVKIEHSRVDRAYFQQVIKGEIQPDTIDTETCKNNILKCYKFFTEQLRKVELSERKRLFSDLLNTSINILVVIDLTDDDDEQSIFDTINSAGVRLTSADTVKNVLFQRAFDFYAQDEVEAFYSDYWEKMFANDDETVAFWAEKRTTGRLQRDNHEILLHAVSVIEGFFDPDKHTLNDLSKIYKEYIAGLDRDGLQVFVKTIAEYAKLYRNRIPVFKADDLFDYVDYEKRLFHILSICDVSTFHPYILHLYQKYGGDECKLKEKLGMLETFVLRRTVCGAETKNYNKLCKGFIDNEAEFEALLAEISDEMFKEKIRYINNNKHAALLLFWVELYRRKNDRRYDREELKWTYTLEHIMPQKWEEFWSDVPVIGEDGNQIADPEAANQYRYKMIYSIGNMTLLKSSLNSAIRNYEFARKIKGEGRKRGIRTYAELGITKLDIVDRYDAGDTIWNEERIRERTQQITDDVMKIWGEVGSIL